jgi:hypothetical protein
MHCRRRKCPAVGTGSARNPTSLPPTLLHETAARMLAGAASRLFRLDRTNHPAILPAWASTPRMRPRETLAITRPPTPGSRSEVQNQKRNTADFNCRSWLKILQAQLGQVDESGSDRMCRRSKRIGFL